MSGKPYKLTYFAITALGEPIRFLLNYSEKPFEDIRINKEDWPAVKPTTPFGQIPTLEIDGKVLWQSRPICRYLAKSVGLAGDSDWESLQIDIAADTIDDLRAALASYFYDPNEAAKEVKKEPLLTQTVPFYLEKLDAQVKANGGYFANGKLSWADIFFAGIADYMSVMAGVDTLYTKYPNLQGVRDTVFALPKIADYIARRPKTPM